MKSTADKLAEALQGAIERSDALLAEYGVIRATRQYGRPGALAPAAEQGEADGLLRELGLDPIRFRSEGGWLNAGKIRAALLHPQDYADLYTTPPPAPKTPRLCIRMEGGVIQDVFSDTPVDVLVIDYDTEGASKDELFPMPQDEEGTIEPCYLQEFASNVMPKEVERINAAITEYEEKGWAKAGM